MTPADWWRIYDIRVGERRYGELLESEVDELLDMLEAAQAKAEIEKNGG